MKTKAQKQQYEAPSTEVFLMVQEGVICNSPNGTNGSLGGYKSMGVDPWSGSSGGSGNTMGGWTDGGEDPWS